MALWFLEKIRLNDLVVSGKNQAKDLVVSGKIRLNDLVVSGKNQGGA
jgi:hypothetical protein